MTFGCCPRLLESVPLLPVMAQPPRPYVQRGCTSACLAMTDEPEDAFTEGRMRFASVPLDWNLRRRPIASGELVSNPSGRIPGKGLRRPVKHGHFSWTFKMLI